MIILYYGITSIFIIFLALNIIPNGIAWIALMDYLDSYRDYCYLSCTTGGYSFLSCPAELEQKKERIINWLKQIGQEDKVIIDYENSIFDRLFCYKRSVFEQCLSLEGWKNIKTGWAFIAMLEQAVLSYENLIKERLSLLFWIDYFKLLYQKIKTLIKWRLATP